jgi:hypothetical protein
LEQFAPASAAIRSQDGFRSGFGLITASRRISFFGDARFQNLPPEFTEITFPPTAGAPRVVPRVSTGLIQSPCRRTFVNTAPRFIPSNIGAVVRGPATRIAGAMVLTLSYLGNGDRNITQIRNINQPLP